MLVITSVYTLDNLRGLMVGMDNLRTSEDRPWLGLGVG
jgi:hypothetical protein